MSKNLITMQVSGKQVQLSLNVKSDKQTRLLIAVEPEVIDTMSIRFESHESETVVDDQW